MPNRNRTAGHSYERDIVKDYKFAGYDNASTSRYTSREQDDLKVDLCGTEGFNVQCKYTKNYPNFYQLLEEMPKALNYNVIHHKKNIGRGKGKQEIVVLSKDDWMQIVEILRTEMLV